LCEKEERSLAVAGSTALELGLVLMGPINMLIGTRFVMRGRR